MEENTAGRDGKVEDDLDRTGEQEASRSQDQDDVRTGRSRGICGFFVIGGEQLSVYHDDYLADQLFALNRAPARPIDK